MLVLSICEHGDLSAGRSTIGVVSSGGCCGAGMRWSCKHDLCPCVADAVGGCWLHGGGDSGSVGVVLERLFSLVWHLWCSEEVSGGVWLSVLVCVVCHCHFSHASTCLECVGG